MMTAAPLLLVVNVFTALLTLTIDQLVVDRAAVLMPAAQERLTAHLRELRAATGAQMAVALIDSTEGEAIEDFSHRIAHEWGGGRRGKDDGLLLVLAIKDHKSRLEVGYGLESKLPDAVARQILDAMRPALRTGDYEAALAQSITAIGKRLGSQLPSREVAPLPVVGETAAPEKSEPPELRAAAPVPEPSIGERIGSFAKFFFIESAPLSWLVMAFMGLVIYGVKRSVSSSSSSGGTTSSSYGSSTDASYSYSSSTDTSYSSSSTDTSFGSSSGGSDTGSSSGGGGDFGGGGASSSW